MQGLQRIMNGGSNPFASNALTMEQLERICVSTNLNNFVSVRNTSKMCLQFHCMLRVSEICNLDFSDIDFAGDLVKIKITRTKTDQTGKGREIYKRRKNTKTNPIEWLIKYMNFLDNTSSGPVFVSATIRGQPQHEV